MTTGVFLAVLAAASLHATWNALVKTGANKQTAVMILTTGQGMLSALALVTVGGLAACDDGGDGGFKGDTTVLPDDPEDYPAWLDEKGPYDAVTCMFALHYFFHSEAAADAVLKNKVGVNYGSKCTLDAS